MRGEVFGILMVATTTWSFAPTRTVLVPVGAEENHGLPLPAVTRPSQSVMRTLADSLSATNTETSVVSTRRRIGPASSSGSCIHVPSFGDGAGEHSFHGEECVRV